VKLDARLRPIEPEAVARGTVKLAALEPLKE
jgi:hypothetical protein